MPALDSCRVLGQSSVPDTRRNLEKRDKIQRASDENKKGIRNNPSQKRWRGSGRELRAATPGWEMDAGGLEAQAHSWLHEEFKASLSYK